MLPQVDVRLPDGRTTPLDSVLGDGFALVGVDVDPLRREDDWTRTARRVGAQYVCIHTDDAAPPESSATPTIHVYDDSGVFEEGCYRTNPELLVRPDRFVMAAERTRSRASSAGDVARLLSLSAAPVSAPSAAAIASSP